MSVFGLQSTVDESVFGHFLTQTVFSEKSVDFGSFIYKYS